ncbi:MAG: glycosyltransferase family 39 protein [Elusimicrobia bacterium]|nr:glycosyltransferase family 39 protein [Elusimicrobiota bacterium]
MKINWKPVLLIFILFIALFLRLYGIRWGLPNKEHFYSYYADEYNVINTLQTINISKFNFTPPIPMYNPTFYYFLVGAAVKFSSMLGLITLTTSKQFYLFNVGEYAKIYLIGHFISVLMGILTMCFVYFIGKIYYSEKTGILAALFFSVVPLSVVSCHYMEPAVTVTFWITLTMFFALNIIYSGKTKWYILAGASCGLAMSSKYTAIPFVAIVTLAHILRKDKIINQNIILFYITVIIFFAFGTPYSVLDFKTFKLNIVPFFKRATIGVGSRGVNWFNPITRLLYYGLGFPILILSICGIVFALIKREKSDLLLLSWIFFYYYIQAQAGFNIVRYQNEYTPFLILLAARFVCDMKKYIQVTVIPLCFFITFVFSLSYVNMMVGPTPQDRASTWISNNIKGGSKIGVINKPYWYSPPVINMKYFALSRYSENPEYNKPDYKIVDLEYDPAKLEKEKPAYIVTSDAEFILNRPITPKTDNLIYQMFSSGKYEEIKRFETFPHFLIFSFKKKDSYPSDWEFPCPTILILKKK